MIANPPKHRSCGAHILLVEPSHFDVHYAINPWMAPAQWQAHEAELRRGAQAGFAALERALTAAGCRLTVLAGEAGLPDMVFPANAAIVLDGRALMARFRHPERRGEEAHFLRHFEQLQALGVVDEVLSVPDGCVQEGAGDCIWDAVRGQFWAGWGPRSDRAAAEHIAQVFRQPVVPLELVTERAYHLDVCFAPLSGGEVVWYPPAFSAESRARVIAQVGDAQLIEASEADLAGFNVNMVNLRRELVMNTCTPRLRRTLSQRGYRVRDVPLAPFTLAGGGAFCMTLRLDRMSQPVGRPDRQALEADA